MKSAFRALAYLVALLVVVQAASMVFAVAGLVIWVEEGGVFDKSAFDNENLSFTGIGGFMVHGMNGMMVIPLVALALLVVSFFAKVPGGIRNAAMVLGLVVLQVALGLFGHDSAYVALLHGVNALVLFTAALWTGYSAGREIRQTTQLRAETPAQV